MNLFKSILFAILFCAALPAQTTLTSTTLSVAITNTDVSFAVASATGITAPTTTPQTLLYVDREAMLVTAISSTTVSVVRGYYNTGAVAHASGATVYVGPPAAFISGNLSGSCTSTAVPYLPRIDVNTGDRYDCPSSTAGANAGLWVKSGQAVSNRYTDGAFFVPSSACNSSVSGNSTGTNGYTTVGASVLPVVQAQTSSTGTNTHTYICAIDVPTRLTTGKGIEITDVVFMYGVQTTALGTQVATLASGTMNSSLVFSYVNFPTAGASETASTVTPVRADSGTLTITPAVASFNTGTTTAGGFYSVKFTPATPIAMTTDLRRLLLTVSLLNTATSATVTNSPGFLVHYNVVPN